MRLGFPARTPANCVSDKSLLIPHNFYSRIGRQCYRERVNLIFLMRENLQYGNAKFSIHNYTCRAAKAILTDISQNKFKLTTWDYDMPTLISVIISRSVYKD